MKKKLIGNILFPLAVILGTQNSNAITMTIGDVDGFGFANPNQYRSSQLYPPDLNNNGILEAGEFLPNLSDHPDHPNKITDYDAFDNRSESEKNLINIIDGSNWTDVSLVAGYAEFIASIKPADSAVFTFSFDVPEVGDNDYGVDHYVNFIFGDYDVYPASFYVEDTLIELRRQPNGFDGLIQLFSADVLWEDMLDGEIIVDLIAPNEPYLAIDYAYLHTDATAYTNSTDVPDLDPVSVPEPSALALMGLGLLGIAGYSRKRKVLVK